MKRSGTWLVIGSLVLLTAGCAVTPPLGPSVVALPPQGKDMTQFQREDASCRQYAATKVAPEITPQNSGISTEQVQRDYDIAYAQCMAADGNHLNPYPISYAPAYSYPYPTYYDPWWGPGFGIGFVGVAGPRFHHHGFGHRMGFAHGHSGGHFGGHSGGHHG